MEAVENNLFSLGPNNMSLQAQEGESETRKQGCPMEFLSEILSGRTQPEVASRQNGVHHWGVCLGCQEPLWDVLGHLDLPRYHTDDVEPSSGPPEQLGVDFRCQKKYFCPEKFSSH